MLLVVLVVSRRMGGGAMCTWTEVPALGSVLVIKGTLCIAIFSLQVWTWTRSAPRPPRSC